MNHEWLANSMPHTLDAFIVQLAAAGLSTVAEARSWLERRPLAERPTEAIELGECLIAANKLTRFQLQELLAGRARLLTLGDYTLEERLGTGAMGQVFRARHRKMNRIVAIKILQPALSRSVDMVARFHREVQVAARLSHPHIVAALDASEHDGTHFLVMEYVEGIDLAQLVKRDGPLPAPLAVDYILQVARGLEHAHAEGIIHRDIKPGNLLVDRKGVVKLLDLGAARMENGWGEPIEPDDDGLTHTGSILGTVDYMSPEQALNLRHTDARSDIYSLGCTLFRLLTNRRIYPGETVLERILGHRELPVPRLIDELPGVPERLSAAFTRMVAKRPEDRYPSMTDLVHDFEQIVLDFVLIHTRAEQDASPHESAPVDPTEDAETVWAQSPPEHAIEAEAAKDDVTDEGSHLVPLDESTDGEPDHAESAQTHDREVPHSAAARFESPDEDDDSSLFRRAARPGGSVAVAERPVAASREPVRDAQPLPQQPAWVWPLLGGAVLLPLVLVGLFSSTPAKLSTPQKVLSGIERIRKQENWIADPVLSERTLDRLRQDIAQDAAAWQTSQERLERLYTRQLDELARVGTQSLVPPLQSETLYQLELPLEFDSRGQDGEAK